jgi:hypothetical protein
MASLPSLAKPTQSRIFWPTNLLPTNAATVISRRALRHASSSAGMLSSIGASGESLSRTNGWLIGWNIRGLVCCIVTIVDEHQMLVQTNHLTPFSHSFVSCRQCQRPRY